MEQDTDGRVWREKGILKRVMGKKCSLKSKRESGEGCFWGFPVETGITIALNLLFGMEYLSDVREVVVHTGASTWSFHQHGDCTSY